MTISDRSNEAPMPEPLGFFLTWPTYGTWLPGDQRGWVEHRQGWKPADETRQDWAAVRMREDACILDLDQRSLVEKTVGDHCRIRQWELFAVNCRSNHIHVVLAANLNPKTVISQLKSWCTRNLKKQQVRRGVVADKVRTQWWAERGSRRYLNDQASLEAAIQYTLEAQ